ncbi:jg23533, partial [Pararge aegeria aegeria]
CLIYFGQGHSWSISKDICHHNQQIGLFRVPIDGPGPVASCGSKRLDHLVGGRPTLRLQVTFHGVTITAPEDPNAYRFSEL